MPCYGNDPFSKGEGGLHVFLSSDFNNPTEFIVGPVIEIDEITHPRDNVPVNMTQPNF